MAASKPTVVVLGAGVIGLQTAISLLSTLKYSVIIIAKHFPGNTFDIEYTSPWAGGHWRSHAGSGPEDAEVRTWDAETYAEWRQLLEKQEGLATDRATMESNMGLGIRESIMYWSEETDETINEGAGLWWRDVVSGFEVLGEKEREKVSQTEGAKVVFAAKYDSVCINIPQYLKHLLETVKNMGAQLLQKTISTQNGVEGVVCEIKDIITQKGPKDARLEAIVLATGLLSRRFLPEDEAEKLYPIRGQTVLVKGESPKAITHVFSAEEISYIIPRPRSGTTILGGCKQIGNWDEKEDSAMTEKIKRRAKMLVPELLNESGEFDVISVQVGRRPGRKGGPKVDLESEAVKGVKIVHEYGHAGAGYQNSIGSARKVVKLLLV